MSKSASGANETYGAAQIAAALGIKRPTLQAWLDRHGVDVESRGAGLARRFPFEQAVWLCTLQTMSRSGFSISNAAEILLAVAKEFIRAARAGGGDAVLLVQNGKPRITDSKSVIEWLSSQDAGEFTDAYILRLAPMVERMRGALDGNDRATDRSENHRAA
jgi:hypothetical protein